MKMKRSVYISVVWVTRVPSLGDRSAHRLPVVNTAHTQSECVRGSVKHSGSG